jgi:hypothetical protein
VGPAIREYQVNASFSDLTEYLDFAAMGHFEAREEKWGFMLDAFYVNLGHSVDNRFGYPVKLDLEDLILGAAGTYRVYQSDKSSFDLTFGARYNEVKTGLTPRWMPAHHKSISWTDPVIGFKGGVRLSKAWTFGYRGDVGGFGAGSDFTWLGVLAKAQLSGISVSDSGSWGTAWTTRRAAVTRSLSTTRRCTGRSSVLRSNGRRLLPVR